jgi:hypothetical protein
MRHERVGWGNTLNTLCNASIHGCLFSFSVVDLFSPLARYYRYHTIDCVRLPAFWVISSRRMGTGQGRLAFWHSEMVYWLLLSTED